MYRLLLLLGPLVVVCCVGCGGKEDTQAPSTVEQVQEEPDPVAEQVQKEPDPVDDTPGTRTEAPTEPQYQAPDVSTTSHPRDAMVRVMVWDDTANKPLHAKAELWFRGHGSFWLKKETKFGAAAEDLGRRQVGIKFDGDDSIQFYPEGRDGQKINIPLMMTRKMNPEGSTRDSIMITISDDEIEILGLPLKAAIGNATMKVQRGG